MLSYSVPQLFDQVNQYLLPMFRIAALMMIVPVLGARVIPQRVRIAIAMVLTVIITPMLPPQNITDLPTAGLVVAIAEQIMIGLMMGFAVKLVFSAIETGGHLIGQTMGLGFAQMVDPNNGISIPIVSQFYTLLATLVFLVLNGHLLLITTLIDSFKVLPVLEMRSQGDAVWQLLSSALWVFKSAVLIALPVMTALLLVNIAFGVVMRAAPQLNIFVIGFPISLLLGFVLILWTLPGYLTQFSQMLDQAFILIATLLRGT